MTEEELRQLVVNALGDGVEDGAGHPGRVLYSDLASVRRAPFYVMGINPGGKTSEGSPIRDNLVAPPGMNLFLDENWGDDGTTKSPLQERVRDLLESLTVSPREVLTTNLAFARSSELAGLANSSAWFRRCWPVHQALLRIVRPSWIILLGYGSAYYFVRERGNGRERQAIEGSKAAWLREASLDIGEAAPLQTHILAVAHPADRGFSQAGLGKATAYPDSLKDSIREHVRQPGMALPWPARGVSGA